MEMSPDSLPALVAYFEAMTPASVAELGRHYTDDARFRDPFNDVRGIAPITRIFDDMFVRLHEPRFTIVEIIRNAQGAVLIWDFDFRIKAVDPQRPRRIHGLSHLRFAADGRVNYHRDYWDAAGELYEQLPVVGIFMRWLKRRAA
jgi:ketosteroid isomerase-like protein